MRHAQVDDFQRAAYRLHRYQDRGEESAGSARSHNNHTATSHDQAHIGPTRRHLPVAGAWNKDGLDHPCRLEHEMVRTAMGIVTAMK